MVRGHPVYITDSGFQMLAAMLHKCETTVTIACADTASNVNKNSQKDRKGTLARKSFESVAEELPLILFSPPVLLAARQK